MSNNFAAGGVLLASPKEILMLKKIVVSVIMVVCLALAAEVHAQQAGPWDSEFTPCVPNDPCCQDPNPSFPYPIPVGCEPYVDPDCYRCLGYKYNGYINCMNEANSTPNQDCGTRIADATDCWNEYLAGIAECESSDGAFTAALADVDGDESFTLLDVDWFHRLHEVKDIRTDIDLDGTVTAFDKIAFANLVMSL